MCGKSGQCMANQGSSGFNIFVEYIQANQGSSGYVFSLKTGSDMLSHIDEANTLLDIPSALYMQFIALLERSKNIPS